MGLLADMKLPPIKANVAQRSLQSIGATSIGTAAISVMLGSVDRLVHKLSRGRATVGGSLGAMPVVMLMTIGARSGEKRVHPLNAVPYQSDIALVGTNYGRGRVPAWAYNLRANPEAVLAYGGGEFEVVAAEADRAEHDEVFAAAIKVYPGYARYRREATNDIPIFLLRAKGSE